jgi:hypothetical protein
MVKKSNNLYNHIVGTHVFFNINKWVHKYICPLFCAIAQKYRDYSDNTSKSVFFIFFINMCGFIHKSISMKHKSYCRDTYMQYDK